MRRLSRIPTPDKPVLTGALYLLAMLCAACSRGAVELPSLPAIQTADLQQGVREKIEKALQEAQTRPGDAASNGQLGMLLHAHDRLDAARVCYERARVLDPAAFTWPYYLASIEKKLGNLDAAAAVLDRALAIQPGYLPAQILMGEIRMEQGRLGEAVKLFAAVLEKQSGSAAAWYGKGRAEASLGRDVLAIESLRKAVELFPQFGQAHYALGQSLRKSGRGDEARAHFALSEKHRTTSPDTGDKVLAEVLRLNVSAGELLRQAAALEAEGKLAEAAGAYQRAIEADPRSAHAHAGLISIYSRLGEPAKAEEAYRSAAAIDPGLADAHYNFGVLRFQQGRVGEAKKLFERTLEINPQHAEAHNNLGYLLDSSGQAAAAMRHYQAAILHQPNHRLAHFHLGRNLTAQRRFAEAIAHFEKTLEPDDEHTPGYLYGLAIAHGRSGNRDRAAEIMRRARAKATERGQSALVTAIDKDMRLLGVRP